MTKRWHKLAALPIAFALVAAACGGDDDGDEPSPDTTAAPDPGDEPDPGDAPDDFGGVSLTITGPERDENEAGALQDVLGAFGQANNIQITYLGDPDWEENIDIQVQGGNPPDITIFPQPGKLADFARAGHIVALPDDVLATVEANWPATWIEFGTVDGSQYGVPVKSDLKSLVWYQPGRFAELGYDVPQTQAELRALMDQMVADGNRPWCVGIESGAATGWPFTDWVEDMMLRLHGPDVYDGWVDNTVPFTDERVIEAMEYVLELWAPEYVFASGGTIAATSFQDNGVPLVNGQCMMHRQASFFAAFIPEGTPFADDSEDAVDVFYFPDIDGTRPVLVAGTLAAGFNDDPATLAVLEYMGTAEYAEARQRAQAARTGGLSGFLSAAIGQDPNVYTPLEQSFLDILEQSAIARFDGSDLMPAAVGNTAFWREGTSIVNGEKSVADGAAAIEAAWDN